MSDHTALAEHLGRAVAWLHDGYGDRLSDDELLSIVRVLFDRAWSCKSAMDAEALLARIQEREAA